MSRPRVVFAVAAGPRMGFGHLLRARALARAMDVPFVVALRGGTRARTAARRLGAVLLAPTRSAIAGRRPDLVVIDDPSLAAGTRRMIDARAAGARVVSVHDLGRNYLGADLTIDGTFRPAVADLAGPAFAVVDPALSSKRARPTRRQAGLVLVALGGGAHVRRWGGAIATAIRRRSPQTRVVLAAGFAGRGPWPLPAGASVAPSGRLSHSLACCSVAILAGGVTFYEGCALGTPIVGLAMTPGQRITIRAAADRGAALDAGLAGPRVAIERAARLATRVLADPGLARRLGGRGRTLVDARGAERVAAHLRTWFTRSEGRRAA